MFRRRKWDVASAGREAPWTCDKNDKLSKPNRHFMGSAVIRCVCSDCNRGREPTGGCYLCSSREDIPPLMRSLGSTQ